MRVMLNMFQRLLLTGLMLFALPVVAMAQDGSAEAGGVPLAPVAAIFTALAGVAVAVSKWLPGWGTYLNIVIGGATAVAATLTTMADSAPTATVSAVVIAVIGAIIARARSETRAVR